ncbi:phytanoyl-CoA dioxygenase family protein [Pleionea sp. CnH1-48]|uniref:phytanoyl-CoA dioxygenase family protein n=1 Tax=Pleionea sp. CnH1-48 TaxID=2954494 RepID=UPI0020977BF0|nr:phytanoyl-CoA dioxygenase family protein [Pleionea sp. CnH1-48]MCO7223358.1 phytanoyl-CoA dioxygenase family protein [Pleionea sp. CnH1-48]
MDSFLRQGFVIISQAVDSDIIERVKQELQASQLSGRAGARDLEESCDSIRALVASHALQKIAEQLLTAPVSVVRVLVFNKGVDSNWGVSWHQDLSVAVTTQQDLPGWKNWRVKQGRLHVQPPVAVLQQMVTLRVALDDQDERNGCLCVIPGSHLFGRLSESEQQDYIEQKSSVSCSLQAGDLLAMSPLLLHASSKSLNNKPRRVVHIEFSNYQLPKPMAWAYR